MSILKRQVNFFSDFSSFFSIITRNSSVNFQLTYFLFQTKESHESTNFDTFKCSGENLPNSSCHFPNHKLFFLQILHDSSMQCHELQLLRTFLGQTLYTWHKKDQSKCKCFRLLSARIRIHEIFVIFETKNRFFFKFCTTLQYHET